jgi:hypothetical protein
MRPGEWFSRRRANELAMAELGPRDTEEALNALRAAMRTVISDGPDNESLGRLVAAYCDQARLEKLTPEHMLVRLKRALDDASWPIGESLTAREAARAQVITLAINAYYDDRR